MAKMTDRETGSMRSERWSIFPAILGASLGYVTPSIIGLFVVAAIIVGLLVAYRIWKFNLFQGMSRQVIWYCALASFSYSIGMDLTKSIWGVTASQLLWVAVLLLSIAGTIWPERESLYLVIRKAFRSKG